MSDQSRPGDKTGAERIREAAQATHRKFLMIFGKEQTPDQIAATIEAKLAEDAR